MKIGLISDTHIPSRAPAISEKVRLAFRNVEMILCAGDLETVSVLDDLENIAPVIAVSGNMDRFQDPIRSPERRIVEIEEHRIGLIHGWGGPDDIADRLRRVFDQSNVSAVVYGHSHRPKVEIIEGILMINPGSPSDRFFAPYLSVGIMTVSKNNPIKAEIIKI